MTEYGLKCGAAVTMRVFKVRYKVVYRELERAESTNGYKEKERRFRRSE